MKLRAHIGGEQKLQITAKSKKRIKQIAQIAANKGIVMKFK